MCPGVDLSFEQLDEPAGEPEPALTLDQLRTFAAAYLDGHPVDDPRVCVLNADLSGFPPMLIQGGTGDSFLSDARRLADHARSHGVEVDFELYPVPTHDFHIFWSFLPEAADAIHQAGQFARRVVAGRQPGSASSGAPS
jgi:acetyl esterase/lipase